MVFEVTQDEQPLKQGYEPTDPDDQLALVAYESMMLEVAKVLAEDANSCVSEAEIQADVKRIIEFERQLSKIVNKDPDTLGGEPLVKPMRIADLRMIFPPVSRF